MKKTRYLLVILIVCGLVVPQRADIQLSIVEWEKLVSAILNTNCPSHPFNTHLLDVNGDGSIDVKDLCTLIAQFSERGTIPAKKQVKVIEAILSGLVDSSFIGKQKCDKLLNLSSFILSSFSENSCNNLNFKNEVRSKNKPKCYKEGLGILPLRC